MGRFVEQFVVLLGETTEVPEAKIERNIGHRDRAFPFPL